MAARTATTPLMMLIITPAMALMTVMMQSPMAWRQDTTTPMLTVFCRCVDCLCFRLWLFLLCKARSAQDGAELLGGGLVVVVGAL